jgi:hypothetical protein
VSQDKAEKEKDGEKGREEGMATVSNFLLEIVFLSECRK